MSVLLHTSLALGASQDSLVLQSICSGLTVELTLSQGSLTRFGNRTIMADEAAGPAPTAIVAYVALEHNTFIVVSELYLDVGSGARPRSTSDDGLVYKANDSRSLCTS